MHGKYLLFFYVLMNRLILLSRRFIYIYIQIRTFQILYPFPKDQAVYIFQWFSVSCICVVSFLARNPISISCVLP